MKKITSILLVFAIALSCFAFVGCDTEDKLGFFKERRIKKDYIERFIVRDKNADGIVLDYYGGNYNGCEIVMLDAECHDPETRTEQIGDSTITYYDSNQLYAWSDGEFYTLPDALSSNKLSSENVTSIIAEYNANITQFADICDEYDFVYYSFSVELQDSYDEETKNRRIYINVLPKLQGQDLIANNYFDIFTIEKIEPETYGSTGLIIGYTIDLWTHSRAALVYTANELSKLPGVSYVGTVKAPSFGSLPDGIS